MYATDRREGDVVTNELDRLVATIERHAPADGVCRTAVPGLIIARLTKPSAPNALVVDPSLCIVAQGAKEVFLAGEVYRYDPAHSLLVSVDLPISARVVEATPAKPCLAVRLSFDPSVVGELLADCSDALPPGPPARGVDVSPVEPQLLDAVGRLVALLDSPRALGPLAPLVLRRSSARRGRGCGRSPPPGHPDSRSRARSGGCGIITPKHSGASHSPGKRR
jgi:hypothetical protein